MGVITGIVMLVIGLISCFFGWRFYRLVLALSGFVTGYYAATGALATQGESIQIIGGIVAGLIVGFLFWTFYKFAYILFGAFLGMVIAVLIANAFNLEGIIALGLTLILVIFGAIAGQSIADLMIRIATAFGGSAQVISGIAAIAAAASISIPLADPSHGGANTESTTGIITLVAVVVLGVVGYLFQTQNSPKS